MLLAIAVSIGVTQTDIAAKEVAAARMIKGQGRSKIKDPSVLNLIGGTLGLLKMGTSKKSSGIK